MRPGAHDGDKVGIRIAVTKELDSRLRQQNVAEMVRLEDQDDLVDPLLQLVRLFPETPELRSGPFGPKVECSDSAPLLDQLVAHLGRQP